MGFEIVVIALLVLIIILGFLYTRHILKKLIFVAQSKVEFLENVKIYKKVLQSFLDKNIYVNDSGLTTLRNYTEDLIEYLDKYKHVFNILNDFEFMEASKEANEGEDDSENRY